VDGFHPLGHAINNGKNLIKTITVLQWANQINMNVRKTPADFWRNNDFQFPSKVNAQNGACHSGLQKS
jgi:hypothetical protein